MKKFVKINFCEIVMTNEKNMMLNYCHGQKSLKNLVIKKNCYFVDFKATLKENSIYDNNPETIKHKNMIPLLIEEFEPLKDIKVCYICEEKLNVKDKRLQKVNDHCDFTRI